MVPRSNATKSSFMEGRLYVYTAISVNHKNARYFERQ